MQRFLINYDNLGDFKIDNITNIANIIKGSNIGIQIFDNLYSSVNETLRDELCDIVFTECNKDIFIGQISSDKMSLFCLQELIKNFIVHDEHRLPQIFDYFLLMTNKKLLIKYLGIENEYFSIPQTFFYDIYLCVILSYAYEYDDIDMVKIIINDEKFCKKIKTFEFDDYLYMKNFELKNLIYYVCKYDHVDFLCMLFENENVLKKYRSNNANFVFQKWISNDLDKVATHPTFAATLNNNMHLLILLLEKCDHDVRSHMSLLNICVMLRKNIMPYEIPVKLFTYGCMNYNFGTFVRNMYDSFDFNIEYYFNRELLCNVDKTIIKQIADHPKSNLYNLIVNQDMYAINFRTYTIVRPKKILCEMNFASIDILDSFSDDETSIDNVTYDNITRVDIENINQYVYPHNQILIEDIIKFYVSTNNFQMLHIIRNKYNINYAATNFLAVKFAYVLSKRESLIYFMCCLDINPYYNKIIMIMSGDNILPKDMIKLIVSNILDELWLNICH